MPTAEQRLNAAWEAQGVAYNPDAAFVRFARARALGRPVGNEYRWQQAGVTYAAQNFDAAFVNCIEGDWVNIAAYDWLTGEPYQAVSPPVVTPPPPPAGLPPYVFPPVLASAGFTGSAGAPVAGKVFYRLSPAAAVTLGVSAFCEAVIIGANGAPAIGAQVVSLRQDGKGEVITAGGDGKVRFYFGSGSAFTPPGVPPFEVFVAEGAVKDDETKLVSWSARLSDSVRVGDPHGSHAETYVQFVGYQADPPRMPA